jgi:hypothetical protein
LGFNEVLSSERVWVEPITTNPEPAGELRGCYRPRGRRLVQNEYGDRLYMDTYGAKWPAFKDCFALPLLVSHIGRIAFGRFFRSVIILQVNFAKVK